MAVIFAGNSQAFRTLRYIVTSSSFPRISPAIAFDRLSLWHSSRCRSRAKLTRRYAQGHGIILGKIYMDSHQSFFAFNHFRKACNHPNCMPQWRFEKVGLKILHISHDGHGMLDSLLFAVIRSESEIPSYKPASFKLLYRKRAIMPSSARPCFIALPIQH
jgi:hypothetical protein